MRRVDLELMSLPILASLLSEKYGVAITVGGQQAYTECNPTQPYYRINIPSSSVDNETYIRCVHGYIDHEVGHIRFTDNKYVQEHLSRSPSQHGLCSYSGKTHLVSHLWNILEDTYVEREMCNLFPGCRMNINRLLRTMFGLSKEQWKARCPSPIMKDDVSYTWIVLSNFILLTQRNMALPEFSEGVRYWENELARIVLTPEGITPLQERIYSLMVDAFKENNNSENNMRWAEKLSDILVDYVNDEKTAAPNALQEVIATMDSTDNDPADTSALNKRLILSNTFQGVPDFSIDVLRYLPQEVQDSQNAAEFTGVALTMIRGGEDGHPRTTKFTHEDISSALSVTARLRAKLRSLIQDYVTNRGGAYQRGTLNTRRLARISCGDGRIFKQRVRTKGINLECIILADMTGSMQGEPAMLESKAMFAIATAFNGIRGVKLGVYGFAANNFVEIIGLGKPFHTNMRIIADGGTFIGQAVEMALTQFSWTDEETKHMLIVLSDGDTYSQDLCTRAMRTAYKFGVDIAAIGLRSHALAKYVHDKDFTFLDKLSSLPNCLFSILSRRFLTCSSVQRV